MTIPYHFISFLQKGANTFILFRISKNYANNMTILSELEKLAMKNNDCFLYIDPYREPLFIDNRDFFILYHKQSDKIVAWVNVINEIINSSHEKIYTTKIDKIVVIKNFANLTHIGTFMIKYILDLYTNTPYRFYDITAAIPQYIEIITNVIYLYTLEIAKPFYDKIDELVCLSDYKSILGMPPKSELIYISFPQIIDDKKRIERLQRIMHTLNILHTFEIDEVDVDQSTFDTKNIDDGCYDLTPPMHGNESIVFKYIHEQVDDLSKINEISIDKYIMTSKRDRAKRKKTI
jgi:hypothetical protein